MLPADYLATLPSTHPFPKSGIGGKKKYIFFFFTVKRSCFGRGMIAGEEGNRNLYNGRDESGPKLCICPRSHGNSDLPGAASRCLTAFNGF